MVHPYRVKATQVRLQYSNEAELRSHMALDHVGAMWQLLILGYQRRQQYPADGQNS